MPGTVPQTQLSIFVSGATTPDNFTIKVYPWDSTTNAVSTTSRTYATGVSRTTASSVNGGTLGNPSNGYGMYPIYQNDYQIELISNTTCTTSATITVDYPTNPLSDVDFLTQIKSIYQPSLFTISENNPSNANPDTINNNNVHLLSGIAILGTVEILPYLDAADFTITANTQLDESGNPVHDQYEFGPFSSFTITKSGKILTLKGNPNTALLVANGAYQGYFKLTYTPSNAFSLFTYWYRPNSN